jgi:chromosome segregation ATPase
MSNRVEELESRVAELQAAVDGLTEELVETRERLRSLEEAEREEPAAPADTAHAETVDAEPPAQGAEADLDAAPEADEDAETDATPPAGTEGEAEDEAADDDEIIVA